MTDQENMADACKEAITWLRYAQDPYKAPEQVALFLVKALREVIHAQNAFAKNYPEFGYGEFK